MNDLISVIVPIYNVEKYIEKGVMSIINQTYDNIEIILVDDGSKDNSSLIIDDLAKNDNRIKVIHKKNGGVSSARNVGLNNSNGKYIVFIDGDDYIESDYIEYFYNLIKKNDYDLAFNCKCFDLTNTTKIISDNYKEYSSSDVIYDIYIGKIGVGVAVWNKMYKKDFLVENNICFDENIWYGEGMLFNIECLSKTNKIIVGDRLVYHQTWNPNSAMRNFNLNSNYCGLKSMELQYKFLKNNKRLINAWMYHKRAFNMSILIGIIKNNKKLEYLQEYKMCISNLRKNINIPLQVDISFKNKILNILTFISPVFVAKYKIKNEKKRLKMQFKK